MNDEGVANALAGVGAIAVLVVGALLAATAILWLVFPWVSLARIRETPRILLDIVAAVRELQRPSPLPPPPPPVGHLISVEPNSETEARRRIE
jgi:hypothetical protein